MASGAAGGAGVAVGGQSPEAAELALREKE